MKANQASHSVRRMWGLLGVLGERLLRMAEASSIRPGAG